MADLSKFRSAIGGFHRGDVADYIESLAVAHKKEERRLSDANEKLTAENAKLAEELGRTQGQLTEREAELARLREEDASLQEQVESLAQEAAELSRRAQEAEEKLAALEADEPDEDACEYGKEAETEPEALQTMELEAYRRAEAMERNALARAERLRAKLSELCGGARTRYADSGEELEALGQDLASVLDRMHDTIAELRATFDETEEAFEELEALDAE